MERSVAKVKLTKGKVALVDSELYQDIKDYRWYAKPSKGNWYAATKTKGLEIFMHNMLKDCPKNMELDHINQNGLDNRLKNLRVATRSQNRANVSRRKDNSSGHKGVSKTTYGNKWRAYICVNKKITHLGTFNSKEQAAKAYNEAAVKVWGDFAWLNEIH
jgi:hypothetical protein